MHGQTSAGENQPKPPSTHRHHKPHYSQRAYLAVKYRTDLLFMLRNFSTADSSDKFTTAKPRVCCWTRAAGLRMPAGADAATERPLIDTYRRRAVEVAAVRVMTTDCVGVYVAYYVVAMYEWARRSTALDSRSRIVRPCVRRQSIGPSINLQIYLQIASLHRLPAWLPGCLALCWHAPIYYVLASRPT